MKIQTPVVVEPDPPPLTRDDPEAIVWPAAANRPTVIVKRFGEWSWCRIEGLASYRFATCSADRSVTCEAHPETRQDVRHLVDAYYRTVVPLALQGCGLEAMHGTALETPAGALVLTGSSHTGKSSLANELAGRGYRLLADDAVIVDLAPDDEPSAFPVVRPVPFGLMLREQAAAHFGIDSGGFASQEANDVLEPRRLAVVVMLERVSDSSVVPSGTTRLAPREAFSNLLASAYSLSLADKERTRTMVGAYLRMSNQVPVYRHSYRSGWEHLAGAADDIEQLLATAVAEGATLPGRQRTG